MPLLLSGHALVVVNMFSKVDGWSRTVRILVIGVDPVIDMIRIQCIRSGFDLNLVLELV